MAVQEKTSPSYTYTEEESVTYLADLKSMSEKEKTELIASDASIHSSSDTATTIVATGPEKADDADAFEPGKSFLIHAHGIRLLRLPFPSSQLQIPIVHADDGTLAYLSTRSKKCSGNAVLTNAAGHELVSTTYFFGPGREPVLSLLPPAPHLSETTLAKTSKNRNHSQDVDTIKTTGKWTSRAQTFTLPGTDTALEWSYRRGWGADGVKRTKLVMYAKAVAGAAAAAADTEEKGLPRKRKIAELVRTEETRTPGTTKSTAGNGGQLILDARAEEVVEESVVVATCILMLKKEVDRRRFIQFMTLTAAMSGGS